MIYIQDEEVVSLTDATKHLPKRRAGKCPHVATLYRWAQQGVRGVKLETIQVGGTLCTSLEALQRSPSGESRGLEFLDEQTEAPLAAASRHELEEEIQLAITRLSPKMRAITVLRYIESLSYEEISEALAISLGTVKSRLSRAHAALDRELTPVLDRHYLR